MSKKKILVAALLLILWVLYSSITHVEKTVRNNIYAQIRNNHELNLSKATDFDWDEIAIFGPYSNCTGINEVIKQKYCDDKYYYVDESANLLIFLQNSKVVSTVETGRMNDYDNSTMRRLIKKSDAVFVLSEQKDYPYKVLKLKESK
jgi:hypothetical protein